MKKNLMLIILGLLFVSNSVYAVVNKPSAPTYDTKAVSTSPSSSMYKKKVNYQSTSVPSVDISSYQDTMTSVTSGGGTVEAQLDSLAMSALKEAEKRNQSGMQSYVMKMMEKGVKEMYRPQVIAKKTPQCPPIKMELNGKNLSGSLCARMGYKYNGQERWVGYCK